MEAKDASMVVDSIEWFNPDKGYGFIETQDGERVFLLRRALAAAGADPSVAAGQTVEFEEMAGGKGRTARIARPCRPAPRSATHKERKL